MLMVEETGVPGGNHQYVIRAEQIKDKHIQENKFGDL
jgi:hypothetical protein